MRGWTKYSIIFLTNWLMLMMYMTWPNSSVATPFAIIATLTGAGFSTFVTYAVSLRE